MPLLPTLINNETCRLEIGPPTYRGNKPYEAYVIDESASRKAAEDLRKATEFEVEKYLEKSVD